MAAVVGRGNREAADATPIREVALVAVLAKVAAVVAVLDRAERNDL